MATKVIINNQRPSAIRLSNKWNFKAGKTEVDFDDFAKFVGSAAFKLFLKPGFLQVDAKSLAIARAQYNKDELNKKLEGAETEEEKAALIEADRLAKEAQMAQDAADKKAAEDKAKKEEQDNKYVLEGPASAAQASSSTQRQQAMESKAAEEKAEAKLKTKAETESSFVTRKLVERFKTK